MLAAGQLTMGPKVAELEAELARACEVEHAVAVSSGTAALHLAVLALGIGPGDEVIVPAYTFPATANVVALVGARPVLVDVDPETMNIDPERVRRDAADEGDPRGAPLRPAGAARGAPGRAGDRGRGRRARRAARRTRVRRRSAPRLPLLPPAQDRHDRRGRRGHDRRRRRSPRRYARCRHHGWRRGDDMPAPGLNYRLSDILCAVGIPQLRRLDELLAARARLAAAYDGAPAPTCRCCCRARTKATSTAGRPTSSRSTGATRCSRSCGSRGSRRRSARTRSTRLGAYRDQG